jgi:hypothetical protein
MLSERPNLSKLLSMTGYLLSMMFILSIVIRGVSLPL